MAKERTPQRLFTASLLHRLETQIAKLEKINVPEHLARIQLEDAIAHLKKEAKILKKVAPHVYVFIPTK